MEADDGWRVGGGKAGGAEGERANARSVTPHCAHLPTRPTPKFELGSQPHRFSSTRLPSSSPPPLVLAHSPIDPLHDKRTERDISPLLVRLRARSVCDPFSLFLLFFSPSLAQRAIGRRVSIEACCPPVVFLRESISMSSTTCLSRSLSLDNHVLVVVLVRHAAKSSISLMYPTHRCLAESVPRRDPIDPPASLLDITLRVTVTYSFISICTHRLTTKIGWMRKKILFFYF